MASYGTLKVDPNELLAKAEHAFRCISACEESLSRITKQVRSSETYWQGEAGELVRMVFEREAEASFKALQELMVYPEDLLEYNGLYSEVIASTQGVADQLATFSLQ